MFSIGDVHAGARQVERRAILVAEGLATFVQPALSAVWANDAELHLEIRAGLPAQFAALKDASPVAPGWMRVR